MALAGCGSKIADRRQTGFNRNLLSVKRAAAVKKALVDIYDIDGTRIEKIDGKGEGEPVADNGSPKGKAKNRRVEFVKL